LRVISDLLRLRLRLVCVYVHVGHLLNRWLG
jgi:hypothetical protein